MNITPRPIIPAQLRGLNHFEGQKQMVFVSLLGIASLAVPIVDKNGQNEDIVLIAFGPCDLDVRVKDPSLLRLDEFRFLRDTVDTHDYEYFTRLFACAKIEQVDINRICVMYYLEDLKRRHGDNIDMELFLQKLRYFKFP